MIFSKTFMSEKYGQVVAIKQKNEYGEPSILLYFNPDGLGVCSAELKKEKSAKGFEKNDKDFDNLDLERIEGTLKGIYLEVFGEEM